MKKLSVEAKKHSNENIVGYDERFFDLGNKEFKQIAQKLRSMRKDKVLSLRVNGEDLKKIKRKAASLGIKYQTFISEVLHQVAQQS